MGSANQAAERLLDPVLAAGAVLRAAGLDATELPLPPMELAELLERREWFAERIAGDPVAQAEARAWATSERESLVAEFGTALAEGRASGAWSEPRRTIARLRALVRMTDAGIARRG